MRLQGRDMPKGIAISRALLALAGQARAQGAYKLARYAYSKLQVRRGIMHCMYSAHWLPATSSRRQSHMNCTARTFARQKCLCYC